jgi:hypothetical protein
VLVNDGVATDVTTDGSSPDDDAPAIDDAHVVYRSGLVATSGRFIRLDNGATDLTLSGPLPLSDAFPPPLAESGWIGYVKQSATVNQVWVRSPAGVDRQASATGLSGALPETLSPDGAVFFPGRGATVPGDAAVRRGDGGRRHAAGAGAVHRRRGVRDHRAIAVAGGVNPQGAGRSRPRLRPGAP